jgi:hypothetical protein
MKTKIHKGELICEDITGTWPSTHFILKRNENGTLFKLDLIRDKVTIYKITQKPAQETLYDVICPHFLE